MALLRLVFRDSLQSIRGEVKLVDLDYSTVTDIVFTKNKALAYYNALREADLSPEELTAEIRKVDEAIFQYESIGLGQYWRIK